MWQQKKVKHSPYIFSSLPHNSVTATWPLVPDPCGGVAHPPPDALSFFETLSRNEAKDLDADTTARLQGILD